AYAVPARGRAGRPVLRGGGAAAAGAGLPRPGARRRAPRRRLGRARPRHRDVPRPRLGSGGHGLPAGVRGGARAGRPDGAGAAAAGGVPRPPDPVRRGPGGPRQRGADGRRPRPPGPRHHRARVRPPAAGLGPGGPAHRRGLAVLPAAAAALGHRRAGARRRGGRADRAAGAARLVPGGRLALPARRRLDPARPGGAPDGPGRPRGRRAGLPADRRPAGPGPDDPRLPDRAAVRAVPEVVRQLVHPAGLRARADPAAAGPGGGTGLAAAAGHVRRRGGPAGAPAERAGAGRAGRPAAAVVLLPAVLGDPGRPGRGDAGRRGHRPRGTPADRPPAHRRRRPVVGQHRPARPVLAGPGAALLQL
ncbi:MAG: hypothetical protein AVDCRST_MAG41-4035, partial [uncultured Corynebacteriales bacterium]